MNKKILMIFVMIFAMVGTAMAVAPTISYPSEGQYLNDTERITWTGDETPWTVEYNDGSWHSICASTSNNFCDWDTTAVADAQYQLRVTDTNTNKNSVNITVDNTAPTGGAITYPNGAEHIGTSATITWGAVTETNYNRTELFYSDDSGGSWNSITTVTSGNLHVWDISSFNDIDFQVRAVHYDVVDNSVSDDSDADFEIDNIPPTLTVDGLSETEVADGDTLTITYTLANHDANDASFFWSIDDGATNNSINCAADCQDGSFDWTVATTSINSNNLKILMSAEDDATPANSKSDTSSAIIVDNAAPTNANETPSNGVTIGALNPTIELDLADNLAGIDTATAVFSLGNSGAGSTELENAISLGAGANGVLSWSAPTLTYAPGGALGADGTTLYVTVDVDDDVSNSMTQKQWSFVIDSRVPTITLNTPVDDTWQTSSSQTMNFDLNTAGYAGTHECNLTIGGVVNETKTGLTNAAGITFTTKNYAEGSTTWNVVCSRDDNGLTGTAGADFTTKIDTIMPGLSLATPAGNVNTNFDVTINLSDATSGLDDDVACKVESQVNVGGWSDWETLAVITDGDTSYGLVKTYTAGALTSGDTVNFRLNCNDIATNPGTQATLSVSFDTSTPNSYAITLNKYDLFKSETIDISVITTVASGSITEVKTVFGDGTEVTLSSDGNNRYSGSADLSTMTLTAGQQQMYVVGKDNFGNQEVQDEDNLVTFTLRDTAGEGYVNQNSTIGIIEEYWTGVRNAVGNLYLKATEIAALYYNQTQLDTFLAAKQDTLIGNETVFDGWDKNETNDVTIASTTAWDKNASNDLVLSTTFGGEVSGLYSALVVNNDALDDQYIELGDTFAGDVGGTYGALSLGTDSVADNEIDYTQVTVLDFTNDAGYLTSYTETDPVWTSASSNYYNKTETHTLLSGKQDTLVGNEAVFTGWDKNSSDDLVCGGVSACETDPVYSASDSAAITSANISDWNTAFGWGDHSIVGYLTSETDPVWTAASTNYYNKTTTDALLATKQNVLIGNEAVFDGWDKNSSDDFNGSWNSLTNIPADIADGDNDTQLTEAQVDAYTNNNGYLTSETDPVFSASASAVITTQNITDWNTAFVWGNHALAGYLTSYTETDPVFTAWNASFVDQVNDPIASCADVNACSVNADTIDGLDSTAFATATALATETTTRTNADTNLQNQIDALETRVGDETTGVNIALKQGWNEFRLPSHVITGTAYTPALNLGGNYSVTNVLSSVNGNYDYVSYHDGTSWRVYAPGNVTTDFTDFPTAANTPDNVFHIHMTATDTLAIGTV